MTPTRLFAQPSWSIVGLLLLALLAHISLYLWQPLPIKAIRNQLFDHYQQWQPRPYVDVGVRIIDIDDTSLDKFGQWPWSRGQLAELLQQLQGCQLQALGFDIVFAEADRTAPATLLKRWSPAEPLKSQLQALPDPDQQFAAALKMHPSVLGFINHDSAQPARLPQHPFRIITQSVNPHSWLQQYPDALHSLPLFEQNIQGNGAIIFSPDLDGVIRKIPMLIDLRQQVFPAFAAEIVRVATQQRNYVITGYANNSLGIERLALGNLSIPTLPNAEMWLYYSEPQAARTIPIWKILQHEIPLSDLTHKILIIGTSAKGLADLRFSPFSGIIPGVEVHAQAVEQILSQQFLLRPVWAESLEVLVFTVGALLVCLTALKRRIFMACGLTLVLSIGLNLLSWYAFSQKHWLLDACTPTLMICSIFVISGLIRHHQSEQRQRWIRSVFSRYVSPNLVNYLISHPGEIELSAQHRECSFIMTDLADSTVFMEHTAPDVVAHCLNTYLDRMIAIAFSFDGTLTRIIGDGIVIVFSAPVTQSNHRQRAIQCALAMQQFAHTYVQDLAIQGISFCRTRIGVNTGVVLIGNFGGNTIFDYRALGDPVNTAARLESANKHIGTSICIAASCFQTEERVSKRPIGYLLLKGKSTPLLAYEPLKPAAGHQDSAYEAAYALLDHDTAAALAAFARLAEARPEDPLVAFHLKRLQTGDEGNVIIFNEK